MPEEWLFHKKKGLFFLFIILDCLFHIVLFIVTQLSLFLSSLLTQHGIKTNNSISKIVMIKIGTIHRTSKAPKEGRSFPPPTRKCLLFFPISLIRERGERGRRREKYFVEKMKQLIYHLFFYCSFYLFIYFIFFFFF